MTGVQTCALPISQQGSIYVFLAIVAFYAKKMRALDREFGVDDD